MCRRSEWLSRDTHCAYSTMASEFYGGVNSTPHLPQWQMRDRALMGVGVPQPGQAGVASSRTSAMGAVTSSTR
jgi:hypothetical protein